ncbi:hypothetical protein CCP3SC1_320023 [Gammaproteobacteria bacterium]
MSDDYDSPWKEILEYFLPHFMAFFFPVAYADIDWGMGFVPLDKELQQVVRDATTGRRYVDKLMKVQRRGGRERVDSGEILVFAHIEIQGDDDVVFAERMYLYNYRIYDRCRCPVASLAVLTDGNSKWRPDRFSQGIWGSCSQSSGFESYHICR